MTWLLGLLLIALNFGLVLLMASWLLGVNGIALFVIWCAAIILCSFFWSPVDRTS